MKFAISKLLSKTRIMIAKLPAHHEADFGTNFCLHTYGALLTSQLPVLVREISCELMIMNNYKLLPHKKYN